MSKHYPDEPETAPRVSVVVPTHNRCELLKETVASVRTQTESRWQLVVVDDASEDGTWPWLQELDDNRIHSIRLQEHSERARARNLGLSACAGEFIMFLDDDDLLPAHALQTHLESFVRYPHVIASIGSHTVFDERGVRKYLKDVGRTQARSIDRDLLFGWCAIGGQTLFRRDILDTVGAWNETPSVSASEGAEGRPSVFAEDHDLFLRVAPLGEVALVAKSLLDYRLHGQWRPSNQESIETSIREQAAQRKEPRQRDEAQRIIRCREMAAEAQRLQSTGAIIAPVLQYAKIFALQPGLFTSPLTRRSLWGSVIRCLIGAAAFNWIRQQLTSLHGTTTRSIAHIRGRRKSV